MQYILQKCILHKCRESAQNAPPPKCALTHLMLPIQLLIIYFEGLKFMEFWGFKKKIVLPI